MKDLKDATQLAFEKGACNTYVNVYKNGRILFTTSETADLLKSLLPLFEAKINTKLDYKGEIQSDEQDYTNATLRTTTTTKKTTNPSLRYSENIGNSKLPRYIHSASSHFTNRNEQKQFNDNIQEEIIKLKDKLMKTEDEVTVIKGEVTILKNENNLLKVEINKITTDNKKLFTNLKQENKQLIQRINKDLSDHVEKIKNKRIEHNPKLNELEKQIEDTKINIIG